MSPALPRQLRDATDPSLRLSAARALGESERIENVPLLTRCAVEDPDPAVRAAARDALLNLIGAQTELSIQAYRSAPDDDDWLIEAEEEEAAEEGEEGLSAEEDQYLAGLITVLRNYSDPAMRLKAIRQLESSSDLRVIAALAETVLWTDDGAVRQAARQSLEGRFGEETDAVIQSYQVLDEFDEQEDEADEDEWDEGESEEAEPAAQQPAWHAPAASPSTASQVVKDEGFPLLFVILAAAGLVVVVFLIILLLGR